jgi:hypothetical protein
VRTATPFPRSGRAPSATLPASLEGGGILGHEVQLPARLRFPMAKPRRRGARSAPPSWPNPPAVDPSVLPRAGSSRWRPIPIPWLRSEVGAERRGRPSSVHPKSCAVRTWIPGEKEDRKRRVPSDRCRCLPEDPVAAFAQRRGSTYSIYVYRRCPSPLRFHHAGRVLFAVPILPVPSRSNPDRCRKPRPGRRAEGEDRARSPTHPSFVVFLESRRPTNTFSPQVSTAQNSEHTCSVSYRRGYTADQPLRRLFEASQLPEHARLAGPMPEGRGNST